MIEKDASGIVQKITEKVHSERIRCLHTHKNISLLYCRDCRKHDIKRAISLAEQDFAKDISKKDYHIEKLRNRISRLEAELKDVMGAHNDVVKHNNKMLHERKRIRKELDKLENIMNKPTQYGSVDADELAGMIIKINDWRLRFAESLKGAV